MIGKTINALTEGGSPPSFDDVMIIPTYSEIRSRGEPDTRSFVTKNIELDIPIISSPMDTVTGSNMAFTMGSNGGLGILHRFMSKEEQALAIEDILRRNAASTLPRLARIVPAIGIGRSEKKRFNYLYERFKDSLSAVAIDIANGDSSYMVEMIKWVEKETSGNIPIIAGNVATGRGFIRLAEAGASAIRVGISDSASSISLRPKTAKLISATL